jgi:hypothetical protein
MKNHVNNLSNFKKLKNISKNSQPVVRVPRRKHIRQRVGGSIKHRQANQKVIRQLEFSKLANLVENQVKVHHSVGGIKKNVEILFVTCALTTLAFLIENY